MCLEGLEREVKLYTCREDLSYFQGIQRKKTRKLLKQLKQR